jgi:hypothetical protein
MLLIVFKVFEQPRPLLDLFNIASIGDAIRASRNPLHPKMFWVMKSSSGIGDASGCFGAIP